MFFFQNFSVPEDLSAYDGLELRLKGDGRKYKLIIRTSSDWDTVGYTASFDTVAGQWQSVSDIKPLNQMAVSINHNFQAMVLFSYPDTLAIFFFEAYISSTNSIRCPTLRPDKCSIIAGMLPLTLLAISCFMVFYLGSWWGIQITAAHVQQVWIWWEIESYFCGRCIWASTIKHPDIHKGSYMSEV